MNRQVRVRALTFLIALVAPVCVALVFRTTAQRVVVPESLMLGVIVTLSLTNGLPAGIVAAAAASSVVSVWAIDFSPQWSFRAANWEDIVAVTASGGVACALAVLLGALRERDRAALRGSVELQAALDSQRLTIVSMQHAWLPDTVPSTPDIKVGWKYRTGGRPETPIGGDWVVRAGRIAQWAVRGAHRWCRRPSRHAGVGRDHEHRGPDPVRGRPRTQC